MKKLLMAWLVPIILVGCNIASEWSVSLPNGSVIKANDYKNRDYKSGDTVCVSQIQSDSWEIDDSGRMKDTMYIHWVKLGSDSVYYFVTYKIGVIR